MEKYAKDFRRAAWEDMRGRWGTMALIAFVGALITGACGILSYIDEHYAEKIRLEDLVEVVHINKYYICKIFQQCTGKTLLNYVNIVRVQKAVEKLISTNDPVTDIAFSVGFQDINYFSRIFKRVMNVSPTEIRKKYRQSE